MIRIGRTQAAALLGMALAGLLAGHSLTYLGLAPSTTVRGDLLAGTGHGYLGRILPVAVALALVSGLFWIASGFLSGRAGRAAPAIGIAPVLMAIQSLGFGAQEAVERLLAGAPLHDIGSVLLLGLPIQVLAAGLAALLVGTLYRAGQALRTLLGGTGPSPAHRLPRTSPIVVRFGSVRVAGTLGSRGPPATSV